MPKALGFQRDAFVGINRDKFFKWPARLCFFGFFAIDGSNIKKRKEALSFFGRAGFSRNKIPCFQVKAADLRNGNIYIPVAGQIVFGAKESIAIW